MKFVIDIKKDVFKKIKLFLANDDEFEESDLSKVKDEEVIKGLFFIMGGGRGNMSDELDLRDEIKIKKMIDIKDEKSLRDRLKEVGK